MRRLGQVFAVFYATLLPLIANAAGVTVSPAFQNIVLSQDMRGKDIIVTFTNQSTLGLNFVLSSADFGTLDESGGVAFLGVPVTELEHRYGLVSWMTFDRNKVFIPPASSKQVQVHIDNRPSLAPGGHYAALLATAVSDAGAISSDPKVSLHQVIASLILVRKDGGAQPGLDLSGITLTPKSWWHLPTSIGLRFHDAGNVHVVPHGTITMKDPGGRVVSKGIINEDSVTVYPESFRKTTSTLQSNRNAWAPGRYTVEASYRFDGSSTAMETTSFWYLGNALVAALIFGIFILIGGTLWLFKKKHRKR